MNITHVLLNNSHSPSSAAAAAAASRTACSPWPAWNGRSVGRPGAGGRRDVHEEARERGDERVDVVVVDAAAQRVRAPDVVGRGAALHRDARQHRDEVEPRRADRRPRPVDDEHALGA